MRKITQDDGDRYSVCKKPFNPQAEQSTSIWQCSTTQHLAPPSR